jgi:hypothetical protein
MNTAYHKANAILADRFETVEQRAGRPEATQDLKEIVDKGVSLITARPETARSTAARHVLGQVASGHHKRLIEEIAADVQDIVRERDGRLLRGITCRHGELRFLPDVLLPATEDAVRQWTAFLNALERRVLIVDDPVTGLRGRIPFRDGAWLSDIIYAAEVTTAVFPPELTRVDGRMTLRGLAPISADIDLHGALTVDIEAIQGGPSPVRRVRGTLRIHAGGIHTPQDLPLSPEILAQWGCVHETAITLNDRVRLHLLHEQAGDDTVPCLVESPGGQRIEARSRRFIWDGARWTRFKRELPPELVYALNKKLQRVCTGLGLGDALLPEDRESPDMLAASAGNIAALLAMGRGAHRPSTARTIDKALREAILRVERPLDGMRPIIAGEAGYRFLGPDQLTASLDAAMRPLSDDRLERAAQALRASCAPEKQGQPKADTRYLRALLKPDRTLDDVLRSGGRTLVFLNNMFTSKAARARAADIITPIRANLRGLLGKKPPQETLIALLKSAGAQTMETLERKYGGHTGAVHQLGTALVNLGTTPPLRLIREFQTATYSAQDEALEADIALLTRLLDYGAGGLDDALRPQHMPPDGHTDGKVLRGCLLVNLHSFLVEAVKNQSFDLDAAPPTAIVERLLAQLDRYLPVLPQYNALCAAAQRNAERKDTS